MTLAELIPLAQEISMGLIVFSLGLSASDGDLVYLFRRPSLLGRSLLAMNVVMPFLAAVAAFAFELRRELEVALIVLAVSPVPPMLPGKQARAGGTASYAIGLLAFSALAAIVVVPASVEILGRVFGRSRQVPMETIAKAVALSVLLPLIAGAAVRRLAPELARRSAKTLSIAGTAVLVLSFVPALAKSGPALFGQVGQFTLLAIVLFALTGLLVGHLLGGPDPADRTVLALSTACRHPGVALTIVHANAMEPAVSVSIFMCFLVCTVATIPYAKWRARA